MSFFRKMFSSDYRSAVEAEAAGNVDLAAEKYALAGEMTGAVRMHLARAARAPTRLAELGALRDAIRWAGEDPALKRQASGALGRALYEAVRAEGIATERDRAKVREAADLLVAGGDHTAAGEALEAIGDHLAAANAYSAGGHVERMETALAADDKRNDAARAEKDAFADYETHMRTGRRDDARSELARAVAVSSVAGEYRRLLDQLDTTLLTSGKVELRRRGKPLIVACAAHKIVLGRDPLCDLTLRAGGVSRQHAEIDHVGGALLLSGAVRGESAGPRSAAQQRGESLERSGGAEPRSAHQRGESLDRGGAVFQLRDLDSRNGTTIGGLPLVGRVPLVGTGRFGLGDECALDFEVVGGTQLVLRVVGGLDRGYALVAADEDQRIDLAPLGLPLDLVFRKGRPLLGRGASTAVVFNDEPLGDVRVQLIRGDRVVVDGDEIDIG